MKNDVLNEIKQRNIIQDGLALKVERIANDMIGSSPRFANKSMTQLNMAVKLLDDHIKETIRIHDELLPERQGWESVMKVKCLDHFCECGVRASYMTTDGRYYCATHIVGSK